MRPLPFLLLLLLVGSLSGFSINGKTLYLEGDDDLGSFLCKSPVRPLYKKEFGFYGPSKSVGSFQGPLMAEIVSRTDHLRLEFKSQNLPTYQPPRFTTKSGRAELVFSQPTDVDLVSCYGISSDLPFSGVNRIVFQGPFLDESPLNLQVTFQGLTQISTPSAYVKSSFEKALETAKKQMIQKLENPEFPACSPNQGKITCLIPSRVSFQAQGLQEFFAIAPNPTSPWPQSLTDVEFASFFPKSFTSSVPETLKVDLEKTLELDLSKNRDSRALDFFLYSAGTAPSLGFSAKYAGTFRNGLGIEYDKKTSLTLRLKGGSALLRNVASVLHWHEGVFADLSCGTTTLVKNNRIVKKFYRVPSGQTCTSKAPRFFRPLGSRIFSQVVIPSGEAAFVCDESVCKEFLPSLRGGQLAVTSPTGPLAIDSNPPGVPS